MRLATKSPSNPDRFHWWAVESPENAHRLILGIEVASPPAETQQWLLSDHGVRLFRYRHGRLAGNGPPVPTFASAEGFSQTRSWLRYCLPAIAPSRELPSAEIDGLTNMGELLDLIGPKWADDRIQPAASLSREVIAADMEAFPHGIMELLAAVMPLAG